MSFEKRKLSVQILANGNRPDNADRVITIDGYRMMAHVVTNGGMDTGHAQVQVFGLPLDQINELTALPSTATISREGQNIAVILSQEGDQAPEVVFVGNIWKAWAAFNNPPDTSFMMHVMSGSPWNVRPHPVTSVKGAVSAASLIEQLSNSVGYGFVNHGVAAQLSNPYCVGSAVRQMQYVQKAARCNLDIDRGTVHIWPRGGYRSGEPIVVGPGNKLIGYPTPGGDALHIRTEFIPNARLGRRVEVQNSQLSVANGTWTAMSATHALAAEMPNGPWFTDMNLIQVNL